MKRNTQEDTDKKEVNGAHPCCFEEMGEVVEEANDVSVGALKQ